MAEMVMLNKSGMFLAVVVITGLLQIVHGLSVTLSKQSVLGMTGDTIWIDCTAFPNKDADISWEKDYKAVPLLPATGKPPGDTYVLMNNTLKLVKLKRRQAGSYRCTASYGEEKTYSDVNVRISYIQKMKPISNTSVYRGNTANIVCEQPLGLPLPKPLWLKDDKIINQDPRIDQTGWDLEIKGANLKDTGKYTCVAMGVKNRTQSAYLTVHKLGPPVTSPKTVEVFENEPASFSCKSTAEPPLPLVWKKQIMDCQKDNSPCPSQLITVSNELNYIKVNNLNGTLEFIRARISDAGQYVCLQFIDTTYESTLVQLNVTQLTRVDFGNNKEKLLDTVRDRVGRVNCPYVGYEPYAIRWEKVGSTELPGKMQVKNATLIITNTSIQDSGTYRCSVFSKYNNNSDTIKIQVYETPTFVVRPTNMSGELGENISVYCQGKGIPTISVRYIKTGGKLNKTRFFDYKNGTLQIKNLQREDAGSYYCWIKHKYTSDMSEFYITFTEEQTLKSTMPMDKTIGIAVGCAAIYILLVIGLMIYCRARRARLLKGIRSEVDDDGNVKDPLVGNESIPLHTKDPLEKYEFDRANLEESKTLGRGKMGRVYQAYAIGLKPEEKRTLVAVKEFQLDDQDHKNEYKLEVEMLQQLRHDNVVELLGVSYSVTPWLLFTNYGEEGDLNEYLKRKTDITNMDRLGMSICVSNGMDYLVKQGYIHRDLAARNCVVKSNRSVMVSFFSLCEDIYEQDYYLLNDIPVPLRWLSPEAIQSESYSEKSDIWSFGVTMWEIFSNGAQPYSDHDNEFVHKHVCTDLALTSPLDCPKAVYEVMEKCWYADPIRRPTFVELSKMLSEVEL